MALRTAAVCTPQIFKNPQLISRVMFVATGCSWQTAGRGGKTQKNDSLSSTTHTSLLGRARDDDRNLRLGLHTAAAIARVRGGSALRALQNHRSLLKAQEDEVACEAAATEGLAESKSQLRQSCTDYSLYYTRQKRERRAAAVPYLIKYRYLLLEC